LGVGLLRYPTGWLAGALCYLFSYGLQSPLIQKQTQKNE